MSKRELTHADWLEVDIASGNLKKKRGERDNKRREGKDLEGSAKYAELDKGHEDGGVEEERRANKRKAYKPVMTQLLLVVASRSAFPCHSLLSFVLPVYVISPERSITASCIPGCCCCPSVYHGCPPKGQ
jgi:hypothetical protein